MNITWHLPSAISVLFVLNLAVGLIGVPLHAAETAGGKSAPEDPVTMDAFTVSGGPVGSFGFTLQIRKDDETGLVKEITVTQVYPHSAADLAGLGPLTSILKIAGRPVSEFVASFNKGSQLNQLLMNRSVGDKIRLEVEILGSTRPRTVTLVERGTVFVRKFSGVSIGH
jgi:C-terminal processing protease CtpA/Prc